MSSSARAVFFGRPPGIFLLTKWITCSLSGARADASTAARRSAALARPRSRLLAARCALKPTSTIAVRMTLIVSRAGRVEEEHRRLARRPEALLAHLAQQVAHVHRDVAEVDVDRARRQALVADGAVVGDVLELLPVADRDAAPRLLLVQERLDQQRRREDLVARAVEQVGARHVRRARRLALAAAQAVLDRVRDLADVALLHDQRLVAHQAEARRVGVGQVGLQHRAARTTASRSSLPWLKRPSGSTRRL